MGFDTRPQPGRPKISAPDAARLLQRDVRTIRRMIEDGELAGGATVGGKQRRWWVYVDQLPRSIENPTSSPSRAFDYEAERTVAELRGENLGLRMQLNTATEANQLLLAAQANVLDIVDQYRRAAAEAIGATDGYRQAADGYRDAAEQYHRATAGFEATTDQLLTVVDKYREALWQYTTPGHPEDASARVGGLDPR